MWEQAEFNLFVHGPDKLWSAVIVAVAAVASASLLCSLSAVPVLPDFCFFAFHTKILTRLIQPALSSDALVYPHVRYEGREHDLCQLMRQWCSLCASHYPSATVCSIHVSGNKDKLLYYGC
jgi:hypothetical protein